MNYFFVLSVSMIKNVVIKEIFNRIKKIKQDEFIIKYVMNIIENCYK